MSWDSSPSVRWDDEDEDQVSGFGQAARL